ncbi:ATP-binding protein [Brevibacterium salitolerans]|uniref:ATP-binding protein n=1 Tax=Brevibacterium salitolerans TaxID=1403566 RepID=A0ABN2X615_9MICO
MAETASRRQPNPYRPGFNQAPMVFAGRQEILDAAGEAMEVAAFDGRTPRPLILVGPRGVGKTVTLGEISHAAAAQHSWPTVHVEATAGGLTETLTVRLRAVRSLLEGRTPTDRQRGGARITGAKVQASILGVGGGIEVERDTTESRRSLDAELRDTMTVAMEREAGLLLTLDELQNASSAELHALGGVLQENVPEGWPLVVAVGALPSLRGKRSGRLPTYLERAEWHTLETLPGSDARAALSGPAERSHRPMTAEAVEALLALSGGYPYAIQVAGHFAWRASHGRTAITEQHAREAEPRIVADLDQLFLSRWEDASPREREYLTALAAAELSHPAPNGGHVAAVLDERVTAVSYLRDRLMKKGTIYRDGAGGLRFITPGMGDWVRRTANPR